MGFGIKELLVVLVIVILLFGTKRLKNIGTDLGSAIKGFKKSVADEDQAVTDTAPEAIDVSQSDIDKNSQKTSADTVDR